VNGLNRKNGVRLGADSGGSDVQHTSARLLTIVSEGVGMDVSKLKGTVGLLAVFLIASFSSNAEQIIHSSGFLFVTTFSGGKPYNPECSTNAVKIRLCSDDRWAFEILPVHGRGDILYGKQDQICMGYDGIDNYFVYYTEAAIAVKNGRPEVVGTKPIKSQPQTAYISPGMFPFVPYDDQKRCQALWLMYISGRYIKSSNSDTFPLPWLAVRYRLDAYGFRVKNDVFSDTLRIPKQLIFIRDEQLDLNDTRELARPELDIDILPKQKFQEDLALRKTNWKNAQVAGRLETTAFTNINECALPLASKFEFSTWAESVPLRRYVLQITNVSVQEVSSDSAKDPFLPPVLAELFVTDSRFRLRDSNRTVSAINYQMVEGENWLPKDSSKLNKIFKLYVNTPEFASGNKVKNSQGMRRLFIIIFLMALTIVPLVFLWKFGRKKKQL